MKAIPTLKYCKDATEFNTHTIKLKNNGLVARTYKEMLDNIFTGIKDKANVGEDSFKKEVHNNAKRLEIIKRTFESFGYEIDVSEPSEGRVWVTFKW